ncbi:hypothetical protein HNQ87_002005 [Pacificimonas flava]|nr:hypothetical protein [Pacificimonas flava]MBB5280836.1 hypothetical protein [Pacificimonas flava]
MSERQNAEVAFLFLGEMLLIPHLYPIVEALGTAAPDLPMDLWVSTSMHEGLLAGWRPPGRVRIRRAPGFHQLPDAVPGTNPPLPAKMPMLARLAPALARTPVAVCAEQTSLWLPRLLPLKTRFVKTSHGVGSMSARDDKRRRAAFFTMVPSERERATYLQRGMNPQRIAATGYVKAAFRHRTATRPRFPEARPVLLYTPHWRAERSSWPVWGQEIVTMLAAQDRYNVILAPHQRLVETCPGVRGALAAVADLPHMHCDLDSFAMVDGSYTAAADLYLGDTSSQLLEFLMTPRPAVFLNTHETDWPSDPSYDMWGAGEVVTRAEDIMAAIARAPQRHADYIAFQQSYAESALGDTSGAAAARAAEQILRILAMPAGGR